MKIFRLSKKFPKEELFGLKSQVRRSSRSVCSNLAEGYRRRRYKAHFVSKLTDADTENSETQVWLDFALACEYLVESEYDELSYEASGIGKLIGFIIENPARFLPISKK